MLCRKLEAVSHALLSKRFEQERIFLNYTLDEKRCFFTFGLGLKDFIAGGLGPGRKICLLFYF